MPIMEEAVLESPLPFLAKAMDEQLESSLTEEDISDYKDAFQAFDKNLTGKISCKDLLYVMRSLGENPSETQFHDIILEMDADKSGKIDFCEFIHFMAVRRADDLEILKQAFEVFDANGDGFICSQEFKDATDKLGNIITREEVAEIIASADINQDGLLDYREFVKMFKDIGN